MIVSSDGSKWNPLIKVVQQKLAKENAVCQKQCKISLVKSTAIRGVFTMDNNGIIAYLRLNINQWTVCCVSTGNDYICGL